MSSVHKMCQVKLHRIRSQFHTGRASTTLSPRLFSLGSRLFTPSESELETTTFLWCSLAQALGPVHRSHLRLCLFLLRRRISKLSIIARLHLRLNLPDKKLHCMATCHLQPKLRLVTFLTDHTHLHCTTTCHSITVFPRNLKVSF